MSLINKYNIFPQRITLELTNRCNLLCSFCPRHLVDFNLGEMDIKLFKKVVDEASQHLPVTLVVFFRGESLLHPQLCEMIRYAKAKGLGPIQLASNGLALTDDIAEQILDSGLDFISFSIDTNDPVIYAQGRKHGDLERTTMNVLNFLKKCDERRKNGRSVPETQVSTVDVPEYRGAQEEFIKFWQRYVDRVRVYIEHSSDGNLGSIEKALLSGNVERQLCRKLVTDVIVYWDGRTAICNHDWDNNLNLGNAHEKTIEEIWNSEKYNQLREMHEKNCFSENTICEKCDHWQMYYLPEGYLGKVYNRISEDNSDGK